MSKKVIVFILAVLFLVGCSKTLKISDFSDTKDIVSINDILSEKTNKLGFELSSIKEADDEYILVYKQNDGSSLKFIYNKEQQIKEFQFLKNGEKNKAYEAYLKIIHSKLDVFEELKAESGMYQKLEEAYPNGSKTDAIEDTRYGKCTVKYDKEVFVLSFDHKSN